MIETTSYAHKYKNIKVKENIMIYLLIAVAIIFVHVLIIDLVTSKRLSIYREIDNYNNNTFKV